jgi:ABC-2 type transport system ATP-binding protein
MTPVVETRKLTKFYGRTRGIVDVDLEVQPGEVFGLLGPNGAGKTTTIRILLDFIRPTSGEARVLGMDCRRDSVAIRRRVGYLPGELATYDHLTGRELFIHLGSLRGGVARASFERLAERLKFDLDRKTGVLSKGNKQKAGVIQAFMGDPELVILDEPTAGLDPLMQEEVHGLILEAAQAGRTVFLSSHILSEAESMCRRVGIIRDGSLVAVETVEALRGRAFRRLEIEFAGPVPSTAFDGLPGVRDVSVLDSRMTCAVTGPLDAVIKTAARFTVLNVTSEQPSLEEVFLAYYNSSDARPRPTADVIPRPDASRHSQEGPGRGASSSPSGSGGA